MTVDPQRTIAGFKELRASTSDEQRLVPESTMATVTERPPMGMKRIVDQRSQRGADPQIRAGRPRPATRLERAFRPVTVSPCRSGNYPGHQEFQMTVAAQRTIAGFKELRASTSDEQSLAPESTMATVRERPPMAMKRIVDQRSQPGADPQIRAGRPRPATRLERAFRPVTVSPCRAETSLGIRNSR